MKKLLACILSTAILCTTLSGCSIGVVEQTNKELTIWVWDKEIYDGGSKNRDYGGNLHVIPFNYFIKEYQTAYPEVKVNFVDMPDLSEADFYKKMSAEILGGKGPDLIFVDDEYGQTQDVVKMMRSGVFADVNEFLNADTDIKIEDYQQAVMDAGIWEGKRYLMPLTYSLPVLISSKELLDKAGFQYANCNNTLTFLQETNQFYEEHKQADTPLLLARGGAIPQYMYNMGLPIIDYKNAKVTFDTPEFQKAAKLYKLVATMDYSEFYPPSHIFTTSPAEEMYDGIALFCNENYWRIIKAAQEIFMRGDTPVFLPLRTSENDINAWIKDAVGIRNNSENKQNAWNFIKLMLSKRGQSQMPIAKVPVQKQIAEIGVHINADIDYTLRYPALPEEVTEQYIKLLDEVGTAFFPSPLVTDLDNKLQPFYKGEQSYESCIKDLKERLELYVSE